MKFYNKSIHLYRYIDDLIVFQHASSSQFGFPISYPKELELVENPCLNNCIHFLDLKIQYSHELNFDIYDKRLYFPFKVITFTPFHSCLHKTVFRNVLINFLLRISKICSKNNQSRNISYILTSALKYNYPKKFIKTLIKQVFPSFI